ncbi:MAG: bifunctional (p)ppGpp synthetase/guanosine-3',5'-bis(diphosphate) 3'-pyrophosphohydrolase [Rickettsiales bacterium]
MTTTEEQSMPSPPPSSDETAPALRPLPAHLTETSDVLKAVRAYLGERDAQTIEEACEFCKKAHEGQMRASGEPYYTHPFDVAILLSSLKLDAATIITGLLHDTIEDTSVTFDDIEKRFGKETATLVDGVTKLAKIKFRSERHKQAENFRKLIVAISEDIRILVVKLADRLHNMRTLSYIRSPEKRRRIAHETIEIYAPLAERIGIQQFRNELQELAFAELYPEIRDSIVSRLEYLRKKGGDVIDRAEKEICDVMQKCDVKGFVKIYGREKTPCSIWRKMERKHISFEQLADIIAYRVIVKDVPSCYEALGAIHRHYKLLPGRFKDYISIPKDNGYQSLHTVVIGPGKRAIEIQIRTEEMQKIAEHGVAAHWSYKEGVGAYRMKGRQYRWLRELLYIMEQAGDSEEFLDNSNIEIYYDQVFCFTPKGDLIALPKGATPVDFAYNVHSSLGSKCVGVKINGHIMPLRTQLENGDQVEIVTSDMQTPSPTWLRFVVTGRAKGEIKRFMRIQKRDEYIKLGRSLLEQELERRELKNAHAILEKAREHTKRKSVDDILASIGQGNLPAADVFRQAGEEGVKPKTPAKSGFTFFDKLSRDKKKKGDSIPIKGLAPGMAVYFAECCHPIPGDHIVGVIVTGKGMTVHTGDCEALASFAATPERMIDVAWDSSAQSSDYLGRLKVTLPHEAGALAHLAEIVAEYGGNINNLKITSRATDFFDLIVDVNVKGVKQLAGIIGALRNSPKIQSVARYKE